MLLRHLVYLFIYSGILWELKRALPLQVTPKFNWDLALFLRHLPLGGGIKTVTSGQAGLAFRLSEHMPTVPLLNARACGREKQFSRWNKRGRTAC